MAPRERPVGTARPPASSELARRIASAAVLAIGALAATWLGGVGFAAVWLAAGLAIVFEWIGMTGIEPAAPLKAVLCLALVAGMAGHFASASAFPVSLGIVGVACFAILAIARSWPYRLWGVAGLAYAALVTFVPVLVRERSEYGMSAVLWMFAVVWATDIAAFFVGRSLGGARLWPRISPNKTWSGFVGGLVFGGLAGLAVAAIATRAHGFHAGFAAAVLIVSALASIASQLGDLFESAMKRRFSVKDSGRLIPGHGGVMDRLDGFAAVAALVGLALAGAGIAEWGRTP